jgi:ATP-dependent Clp protease ATP-binding subunit ClpA
MSPRRRAREEEPGAVRFVPRTPSEVQAATQFAAPAMAAVRPPASERAPIGRDPATVVEWMRAGPRAPLPYQAELRRFFGRRLDGIEVHADDRAAEACELLGARAFTVGNVVAFADRAPPLSRVVHEVAHVVQQDAAAPPRFAPGSLSVSDPSSAVEREAAAVARGASPVTLGRAPIRVYREEDTDPARFTKKVEERLYKAMQDPSLALADHTPDTSPFGVSAASWYETFKRASPKPWRKEEYRAATGATDDQAEADLRDAFKPDWPGSLAKAGYRIESEQIHLAKVADPGVKQHKAYTFVGSEPAVPETGRVEDLRRPQRIKTFANESAWKVQPLAAPVFGVRKKGEKTPSAIFSSSSKEPFQLADYLAFLKDRGRIADVNDAAAKEDLRMFVANDTMAKRGVPSATGTAYLVPVVEPDDEDFKKAFYYALLPDYQTEIQFADKTRIREQTSPEKILKAYNETFLKGLLEILETPGKKIRDKDVIPIAKQQDLVAALKAIQKTIEDKLKAIDDAKLDPSKPAPTTGELTKTAEDARHAFVQAVIKHYDDVAALHQHLGESGIFEKKLKLDPTKKPETFVFEKIRGTCWEDWIADRYPVVKTDPEHVPVFGKLEGEKLVKSELLQKVRRGDGKILTKDRKQIIFEAKFVTATPTPEHIAQMQDYALICGWDPVKKAKTKPLTGYFYDPAGKKWITAGTWEYVVYSFTAKEQHDAWRTELDANLDGKWKGFYPGADPSVLTGWDENPVIQIRIKDANKREHTFPPFDEPAPKHPGIELKRVHLKLVAERDPTMRFTFKCHVVKHVSGRVTVTPIELPGLAVHATTIPRAVEELTLAIDDRISRAHPKRLFDFTRPSIGEPVTLDVPVLKVRGAGGAPIRLRRSGGSDGQELPSDDDEPAYLRVFALRGPAHRPYVEVRAPRLDVRLWLTGKDVKPQAEELIRAQLEELDDHALLSLRPEGAETWMELEVDVTPPRLSDLERRELTLDERPAIPIAQAARAEADAEADDDEDGARAKDEDDDWDDDRRKRRKKPEKKKKRPPTPTLARIGTPWHTLAADEALDPAYERDELVERLRARLQVADPEPLVLVGPSGSGKTAILQELARRLAADEAAAQKTAKDREPDPRPIFYVDGPRLISGRGFFGEWQQQTLESMREARAAGAILILGHVVELLDAGKSAHSDQNVAQLIAPALAAREVIVLGEATPEEWAQVERRNASLARSFAVLRVDEPPPDVVGKILARVAADLTTEKGLRIEPPAVAETQALCARFMPYGALVGNGVSFLRRLVETRAQAMATKVGAADAMAQFSSESGIPARLLDDAVPLDEADVRAFLSARVKGQEAAVARVAQVVSVIKANLADRRRPTAVLLFAGPTGVGKTELSKALAELIFGSRDRLIRLDMGELAGPDALVRLVGDGGTPGQLTRAVRRQPFSVVLLDEIEKAHPAVFDALLGVLGEGRLTDASGRLTDFRSTILVLTSNLGADTRRDRVGFGGGASASALDSHYRGEAQRFFRPELYNRLDDIIVFRSLEGAEIRAIVDRELDRVAARDGFRRRDVQLVVSTNARELLAQRGLDPRYGARPLKRTIERLLVSPVSSWIAAHPTSGATRLEVDSRERGDLAMTAASLGGAEEGVSRKHIERILEWAARTRAEVRAWARSTPMRRLLQDLSLFDRLSRQPTFWHDRAIADERARAAAEGRELAAAFGAAEKQAETAEDLAYEAYYSRQVADSMSLAEELQAVERQLVELGERLFATMFPPRNPVSLILTTAHSGWSHLVSLCDSIEGWVKRRGGSVVWQTPVETTTTTTTTATATTTKQRAKAKKHPAKKTWKWRKARPVEGDSPPPPAVVVTASGATALMLLAAEHGAHRFTQGGTTSIVKVTFEPKGAGTLTNEDPAALEAAQPNDEIRRVWPDKKIVHDLRLDRRFDLGEDGRIDLGTLLAAYQRWRVFVASGGSE